MIWCLQNNAVKERLISEIRAAPIGTYVDILENDPTRSRQQNNLYWKWVTYLGNHFGYKKEPMHCELAEHFLPPLVWVNRKGVERVSARSTTSLTVAEFSEYLDKVGMLALKQGISLPSDSYYGLEK